MSIEETIRNACAEHDLTSMSVSVRVGVHAWVSVYLHWGENECVSGGGKTYEDAMEVAVHDMKIDRAPLEEAMEMEE